MSGFKVKKQGRGVIVELDPNVRLPSYNSPEERDQLAEAAASSIVEQALKKAEDDEEEEEEVVEPVRKISGPEPTSKMKIGEEDEDDEDNASNVSALSGASLTEEVQEDGSVVITDPGVYTLPDDITDRIRLCYKGIFFKTYIKIHSFINNLFDLGMGGMKPVWLGNSNSNPGFKYNNNGTEGNFSIFSTHHIFHSLIY